MADYKFTYPSIPEAESSMYDHVREIILSNGVGDYDLQRFMVIVSEAFTNALLHGNDSEPSKHIMINLSINETWIAADIVDEGCKGIQIARKEDTMGATLPEPSSESGRGLALIRHYAEEVHFSEAETGGLKLTVRLERGKREKKEITQL